MHVENKDKLRVNNFTLCLEVSNKKGSETLLSSNKRSTKNKPKIKRRSSKYKN